jgi:hypothetical protein
MGSEGAVFEVAIVFEDTIEGKKMLSLEIREGFFFTVNHIKLSSTLMKTYRSTELVSCVGMDNMRGKPSVLFFF